MLLNLQFTYSEYVWTLCNVAARNPDAIPSYQPLLTQPRHWHAYTVKLNKISNWELVLVFCFGPALVRLLSWVGFLIFIKFIFQIWKYVSGLYSVKICFSAKTVYWNHATATFTDLSYYMHAVLASLVALLTGAQNKTRHCLVAIRIYIQKWVGFISAFRSIINPLYIIRVDPHVQHNPYMLKHCR